MKVKEKTRAEGESFSGLRDRSLSRNVFMSLDYIVVISMTILSILPIWHILAMSFSDAAAVEGGLVGLLPVNFTLNNYKFIVSNTKFYNAFLNSVKRVVIAVPFSVFCSVLVAYPLSKTRERFHMRNVYSWLFIVTMLFSGGVVPTYMVIKYTGIYNTIWSLILPSAVVVFNMLILMNFFRELPKELEEAALIDGAGHFTILFRIFVPLAKPALATLILFIFVNHWNSWFDGLLYLPRQEDYPLQTYLQTILTMPDTTSMTAIELLEFGKRSRRAVNAAQIVVSTIPIMVIYPFLQKYYTKGMVLGSVKG